MSKFTPGSRAGGGGSMVTEPFDLSRFIDGVASRFEHEQRVFQEEVGTGLAITHCRNARPDSLSALVASPRKLASGLPATPLGVTGP